MAILTLATLKYGSTLCADVSIVGSYIDDHPTRKTGLERPIYDVNRLFIRDIGRVAKDRKTSGVVRARFAGDALDAAGRLFEYRDDKATIKEYTLSNRERTALKALNHSGLPANMEIQWDRLVRGPMSPTLEQQVSYIKEDTAADGTSFTITAPDSGNLLLIGHGYYWRNASPGEPTASANSLNFTRRGYAGSAANEVLQAILDREANGSEGTTVIVTNGGTSQENSGGFLEYSGMVSSAFVAISAGADGGTGDVTSIGTGNVDTDTPNKPNCLLVATFGTDGAPTSWGYTNSFTEVLESQSGSGGSDHSTRIATREVSAESSTYNTTASWTTGVAASGIVAAYEYVSASPPVSTLPASGKCIKTYDETAVPGISVAEGSSPVVSIATTSTAGSTLTYDTTGTSVTISGNGTNAATLLNGASITEYNTVLGTLTMRGATPDTTITVTIIPTDGTLNDSDQFTVLCDPASITITGTNNNVVAAVASLQIRLLAGQINDTISVNVVDDTGGTPLESDSEFIVGLASYFSPPSGSGGDVGQCRMFHYLGLGF